MKWLTGDLRATLATLAPGSVQAERRVCPECRQRRPLGWFAPMAWCGSPDCPHDLCAICQEQQRAEWAHRLEWFFVDTVAA